MASELSDKLLAEILELDAEMTVTMHIKMVDQLKAIMMIRGKISDIGRMKVEEQKKLDAENSEIVDMVRGMSVSLTDLPDLLKKLKASSLGQVVPKSEPEDKEENE